jgi:hypothetical protein
MKRKAVPHIIIRPSVVLPDVEVIHRRAEKKLAYVVESLGECIGETVVAPFDGTLHERDMQTVIP